MDNMKDLKSMLELQVNQIVAKGDINPQDLEMLDKAVDVIKDIETICAMRKAEENEEKGYSQRSGQRQNGYSYAVDMAMNDGGYSQGWFDPAYHGGRYNYYTNGGTHTDGMSYGERPSRMMYRQGRDSNGRYSSRRGYSRDEAKDHMLDTLEDMMDEATTEKERNAIRRCMEKIEA